MPKKLILRIIFIFLVISISFPLYFVIETIATSIVLKSVSNKMKVVKPKIEYIAFSNLESITKKPFNGNNYTIYTSARQTKGTAEITRGTKQNILLQNTDIIDVHGSAQNQTTKDIYHFECDTLNVSSVDNTIRLYKKFYIALETGKDKQVVEMRGDSITFNTVNGSIVSNSPVVFNAKDMILVAGNFLFQNDRILITNEVFSDSKTMAISSNEAEILLSSKSGLISNNKLAIETMTFRHNVKLFDRTNNTSIVADLIKLDKKKNLAFLEGNVVIKRPDGTVSGDRLTYNLTNDFTKIEGKKNEMVEIRVKF
jgi:lipopolysaccharide export system protein LptA